MSDYDEDAQESIKTVLAREADVDTSAVTLSLTAGSVIVSATIYFESQADADSKSSALASGILNDAASLETALTTQFTSDGVSTSNLTVEALTPPTATVEGEGGSGEVPPSPPSPSLGEGESFDPNIAIAIAVGTVVVVLGVIGWCYCMKRNSKAASTPATGVSL